MLALKIIATVFCGISIITKCFFTASSGEDEGGLLYSLLSIGAHIFIIAAVWII